MKLDVLLVLTLAGLAVGVTGCGTRQPVAEVQAPEPVVAEARTCANPVVGPNTRITSAIGESNSPVITWSNDTFAVSWWDMRGRFPSVHAVRIDKEGVHRSPERKLDNEGRAREQTLAADSAEMHLVWLDEEKVKSIRIGPTDSEARTLATESGAPAAGPWGAAAWVSKGNLFFRCDGMVPPPGKDGVPVEPEPALVYRGGIEDPAIAWSGSHYAVVWSNSVKGGRQILMQRMSPKGARIGKPVQVSATAGVSRQPVVVWTGTDYAVAWTNAAPGDQNPRDRYRIFLAIVPPVGSSPRLTRQLAFQGSADQVALASTGKEFGLAWVGSKEPMGSAVYFQRVDAEVQPIGETVKVTDDKPLTCGRPSLVWASDGYGVTWHDDREPAGSEVFFSFLACGEEDAAPAATGGDSTGAADAGAAAETAPEQPAEPPADTPDLKDVF